MSVLPGYNGRERPSYESDRPIWWVGTISILISTVLGILLYGLLPAIGIELPGNLLSGNNIIVFLFIGMVGYGYLEFLNYIRNHPQAFLLFISIAGPSIIFGALLGRQYGLNLHATVLIAGLALLPMLLMLWKQLPDLFSRYPYIRALSIYMGMTLLYFFFYHSDFAAPQTAEAAAQGLDGNQSLPSIQLFDNTYQFLICCTGVYILGHSTDFTKLFFQFNRCICIFTIAASIIPLFFFLTTQRFGIYLEGIFRFSGIFFHPNMNALFLGLLSLYLLGIVLYYRTWARQSLLLPSVGSFCALLGSLFSLSKTSLASYAVLLVVLLLVYLPLIKVNIKRILVFLFFFTIACLLVFFVINILTDGAWMTVLISRFEDNGSFDWRVKLWGEILDSFDLRTLLIGNGLGSAVPKVIGMRFHANDMPDANALNMHNLPLQSIFEFGILGLAQITGMILSILDLLPLITKRTIQEQPELYFLLALQAIITLYFVMFLLFNLNTYIFDALYWIITSVLYMQIIKSAHSKNGQTQTGKILYESQIQSPV